MAIATDTLLNFARSQDLRIEALNEPTTPGQPHVFRVRPLALVMPVLGGLIDPATALPISITVSWSVENAGGVTLAADEAVVYARRGNALEATVMVLPDFVELTRTYQPGTKTRYVAATAVLGVTQGTETTTVELPLVRHPITVPAVPVPTLAMFFHARKLGIEGNSLASGHQFLLIGVPGDSPIAGVAALRGALDTLRRVSQTADNIASLAGLAGVGLASLTSLGTGLDEVIHAIDLHRPKSNVGVAFLVGDGVRNLNDIEMVRQRWNDIEAEDEISSIVFLGPPGRMLNIHRDDNFSGTSNRITASAQCLTIVRRLTQGPPVTEPSGLSGGTAVLDNAISSYAFV